MTRAVVRAKQGDRAALGYLYSRYADCVYGFVASIVCDDDEAEDVAQHVFLRLMTKIDRYEEQETPFVAWLLRVARNVAVDHLRQRREVAVEEVYESSAVSDRPGIEHAMSLRDALHALPAEQLEVVVLRHVAGLSPGEIALRMGKTESSVHGLHHRGRGALKDELSRTSSAPATTHCRSEAADLA